MGSFFIKCVAVWGKTHETIAVRQPSILQNQFHNHPTSYGRRGVSSYCWLHCWLKNLSNVTTNKFIKVSHGWILVRGIHWGPVDSFYKGTVVRKPLLNHSIAMIVRTLFSTQHCASNNPQFAIFDHTQAFRLPSHCARWVWFGCALQESINQTPLNA